MYWLLYAEQLAPLIVDVLADGLAGDYALLAELRPSVDAGIGESLYAIRCNDYGTRRRAAGYLLLDEVIGARHPRFFGRFYVAFRLATCSAWPAADPPIIRNVQHKVDVPILLFVNDFDPATPPAFTRNLAHALGMERSVFRYAGGGHTFNKDDPCTFNVLVAYLLELQLPADGGFCPGQPISFAADTSTLQRQATDRWNQWYLDGMLIR